MRVKDFSPDSLEADARRSFYIEENIGTVEDPEYIYHLNVEVNPVDVNEPSAFWVLKTRVFDGVAFLVGLSNQVRLYWKKDSDVDPIHVASADLIAEVETSPSVWQSETFSFASANYSKITEDAVYYRAWITRDVLGVTGAFGLELHWDTRSKLWKFYLDVPGQNVRIKWRATVLQNAVSQKELYDENGVPITPAKKGISWRTDYPNVNHVSQPAADPDWTDHQWTFEPLGKLCDVEDGRTLLQRYEDVAGLLVEA